MEHMDEMGYEEQVREETIRKAMERFGALIREDFKRIDGMKQALGRKDFKKLDHITVGILPGDGIGPYIMEQALRVAKYLLKEEMASGKVEFRTIPGMTIEERAKKNESLPAEVLEACKACDVLVKGPFVTPRAGDPWPNLVSANSLLRRALQLYAAVRPVRIPEKGIDWTFFRENIEGEYIWGNKGIQVNDDLAVDFKVLTRPGAERICRAAFEFAKNNGKTNVTVVTKANIVKLVDGNFLKTAHALEKEYPGITVREELVDAMAAKITDPEFTKGMEVFLLPNLYGDIVTDVAAEYQFFQHRGPVRPVRSHPRGGELPGPAPPGSVCGSLQPDPGHGRNDQPHRVCGQEGKASEGSGHLHPDRTESGDHHRQGRSHGGRVHGLSAGDFEEGRVKRKPERVKRC